MIILSLLIGVASAEPPVARIVSQAVSSLPAAGADVAAFVPKGWTKVQEVSGDLNGDGHADRALVLGLSPRDNGTPGSILSGDCYETPSIIVVLHAAGNGFRKAAVNDRLYPRDCEISQPSLSISKGVLIANHNWRDGWAVDTTFRFRAGPDGRLRLIGYDFENYSRMSIIQGRKTSENYLTGERIRSAKSESSAYRIVKRERIGKAQLPFEEAALVEDGEGDFHPFR
jgi:hypothetical protein